MQQLITNFDESGDLKMNDLTFFNVLSSSDLRKQESKIIADLLDNVFRIGRGAKYEEGIDRSKAISSMIEILSDEDKQVKELAFTVDEAYLFWGE
jgi:predicted RNase H-related nuclease YkuK (DUF458 family)